MEKFGKTSSIFEFAISKLGYMEIFMKIREKNEMKKFFNYFTILTFIIGLMKMGKKLMPKKKMRMKKFGRMNLSFELSISILGYMTIYTENLRRKSLTHY